ncbi:MAG: tetratricopeptide (TPR) repeat protein [Planctomycetota bacterium]
MDFSKHIQKAEEAERRRNFDFAVQLYQQLLEIDLNQGEARAGLRRVLKKRHEAKRGGKFFSKLKGAGPLAAGKTMAKAGRNDGAAKQLETYLASNPMDVAANLLLGNCLENGEHFKSALAVYEFVAEIAPKNPEGLKRSGAMMHKAGDVPKALEYYERALEADPRDRDALKARKDLSAETALHQARYDTVEHSREQIKDKDEAQRLEMSSRRHLSEEELEAELERLESRYADNPSDADLMLAMADVLERMRDPEAALDLVERALSYRKDSIDLRTRCSGLKAKALKKRIARADKDGDQEAADRYEGELREFEVTDLRQQLELQPGNALLRLQLGKTLLRQDQFDAAAGELQKAVTDPRLADDALYLLAQCFQQKGFLDLAKKEYKKALEKHPKIDERARDILYQLGNIAEDEGDQEEARTFYARIYEVDIGYKDVAGKMESLR